MVGNVLSIFWSAGNNLPAMPRWRRHSRHLLVFGLVCAFAIHAAQSETIPERVDTALVISIDVSSSVNDERYRLQLEGIAAALEDPGVITSVLSGPIGNIAVAVVTWADDPRLAIPWTIISSAQEAAKMANRIRSLPPQDGKFTCLGGMMRYTADKVLFRLPVPATKIVVDVSGDGADNCSAEGLLSNARQDLISAGATINGLPILEGPTSEGLEDWYRNNVIGGNSAFIMPANGYSDFERAFRQKFIIEMSALKFGPLADNFDAALSNATQPHR